MRFMPKFTTVVQYACLAMSVSFVVAILVGLAQNNQPRPMDRMPVKSAKATKVQPVKGLDKFIKANKI